MADNTAITPGSGETIRDKDRSGVKTQIVGIDLTPNDATEKLMGAANPLPAFLTSPAANAAGIFAMLNPYGGQRVSVEPSVTLFDPFDGATIDTNRWTASTNVAQSNGALTINPAVGASVNNNGTLISTGTFASSGLGFVIMAGVITLEAAQVNTVNVHRFWGKGQVTSFAYATPITDGIGFEIEGATGALQCVVYVGGTKYVINSTTATQISSSISGAGGSATALPSGATGTNYGTALTWKGGPHRYAIFCRSDVIYWFAEGQEVPIAAVSYLGPNFQAMPLRAHAITNGAATSLAYTFALGAVSVNDSTAQNAILSDATYPQRKAVVGKNGGLSVKGAPVAGQTLPVTAATPVTGTGLDVSEAGNVTFVVKNTVAATAYTGVPVIVFEQSDDNVSWAPLPVASSSTVGAASSSPTIATGAANTEQMFDAGLEGVNWIRVRVVTAQATNGMTVVTLPGGLAFSPVVATGGVVNAAGAMSVVTTPTRVQMSFALVAAGLTAGTSGTDALVVLGQEFRAGVSISTTNTSVPITANKTFRVTSMTVSIKANAALVSSAIFTLRYNPTGAATNASAPAATLAVGVPAVSGQLASTTVMFGEGVDLAGGATPGQFGISVLPTWVTTAPTIYVSFTGYEY